MRLTHRLSPRALMIATMTAAAVLAPATSAFADASPTPSAAPAKPSAPAKVDLSAERPGAGANGAVVTPRGGVAAGDKPVVERGKGGPVTTPRGGVAAGDKPVVQGGKDGAVTPRGGVAAGDKPAVDPKRATPAPAVGQPAAESKRAGATRPPRGGVAAGDRPAEASGNSTAAIAGSAIGFALLAGAGTFVVRRRATAN